MLGSVADEALNATHDGVEEDRTINQGTESRDLARNRCPHLCFVVLEQLYESRNQVPRNNFLIDSLGNLLST